MLPSKDRVVKFTGYNITELEVRYCVDRCFNNEDAARYLKISIDTWKKYANRYINPKTGNTYWKDLQQIKKHNKPGRVKTNTEECLDGIRKVQNRRIFLERLIEYGFFPEVCQYCGFNEKRVTDMRCPLVLAFSDGDITNGKIENILILCYNCYALTQGDMAIK